MAPKINFSKNVIGALRAPVAGERDVYIDSVIPNLQLRVTANGVKTFSLFRRAKAGSPTRMTLGRFPKMTVEGARKQAAQYNLMFEAGSNPASIRRDKRKERTFAELFEDYLARHAKLAKRTWKEDAAKYERYLVRTLGPKKLSGIARPDIAAIHAAITKDGHSITANRVLALVSGVFGWAMSVDLVTANPAIGVKKNPETKRARFLQPKELPRFFEALSEEPNTTIRDYFLVSLLTGARRANVLSMRWKDLELDEARWEIARTKNGDPQTIPLMREVVAVLENRQKDAQSAYVFPGIGKLGHLVEPKAGWRRIFDRDEVRQLSNAIVAAGGELPDVERETLEQTLNRARQTAKRHKIDVSTIRMADLRIHDLRRTLGSWQAKTGASLAIIGKSLNHKSVQTTAIYSRLDLDPVRDSMTRATSAMMAAARGGEAAEVQKIRKKSKR